MESNKIILKDESYKIIGACMKVHRVMGSGFLEAVYQEALEKEFTREHIPFQKQTHLDVFFDEEKLKKYYIADFVCFNQIILEIKALPFLPKDTYLQLTNYLKATKMKLGILVNFGTSSLTYKRIVN